MVINKARMSEVNSQAFGLLRGWVQAEFIGFSDEHTFILAFMFYLGKEIYEGVYGKDLFTFSSPQQAAGYSRRCLIKKSPANKPGILLLTVLLPPQPEP